MLTVAKPNGAVAQLIVAKMTPPKSEDSFTKGIRKTGSFPVFELYTLYVECYMSSYIIYVM